MIRINNHNQESFFDPWDFLSPKRRQLLDQSWAGLFQKELLCELPVREIAPFFKEDFGRPTKELHTVLGTLVLQQTHDLTDEETVNQLAFNIQWHYALNITSESDSAKYMCPKTLWNMRNMVVENDLDTLLFECISDKLAKVFKVNTDKQRIDSVHIKSNMRRLGRISIFVKSMNNFLRDLKHNHEDLFNTVEKGIVEKYLPEKSLQCFSMIKPSESGRTLSTLSTDLFDLVQQFKDHPEISKLDSYKLLERVLKEQCNLSESDEKETVEVKKPKDIPSDSLQNPSDPDATYSGHKGQGYQAQIMETYCDDEEAKEKTLNLITHVQVDPAHESDANALIPAIESTKERDLAPEQVLGDALYGSDENCQKASKLGVDVISPTMGSKEQGDIDLSDFEVNKDGTILSCPQGHCSVRTKTKKTRHSTAFDSEHCSNCPNLNNCPVKLGKKYYYLRYTDKEMRLAQRRAYERTDEFKDRYRWRSGVEGTMSEYDRRTGVKQLRVRGFKRVRFCAKLKATGLNILRAAAVRRAVSCDKTGDKSGLSGQLHAYFVIKEHALTVMNRLRNIFTPFASYFGHMPKIAA
jgi:hypothetical protein